ncbi:MAG: hypothetical protein EA393_02215 [Bacteroidetes bacterium]|nr:MAG: hypothetical protein EA393_02215 [Bacteroidota bacterium]
MSGFLRYFVFFLVIGYLSQDALGQNNRRELQAVRTDNPPVIDGKLNEPEWEKAPVATGFHQYEPHNDRPASFETFVRILYDDDALYIGARMMDPEPEKILTELGLRDSGNNLNADLFWLDINPFDDGINGFRFQVSASGVQTDINLSGAGSSRGDVNWDAVWLSEVSMDEHGWVVEMKIPYSALRFPRNDIQKWGINFWREIRRTREQSSWNFVNRRIGDPLAFLGLLNGIEGITPPLRLSLFPYLSSYLEKNGGGDQWGSSFIGGMDLKYGISNSFTMDMTLIPDFGQVQSDARVLNLSPYEVKYDENRQFFTEGTELFGKADIFYSRRIGNLPRGFANAYKELNEHEIVAENPLETRLINATKISGRTSAGLGLGFFNSMTAPSRANIRDTLTGMERSITTQPFTNYNVFVADQSLQNNSFISFINTNVTGSQPGYVANVSATEFRLMDASNMFRVSGNAALSQQYHSGEENTFGYKYDITAGKVGGKWQYTYNRLVLSYTYDPNDLGFLSFNNLVMDKVSFSYNIFDPFWRLWNLRNEISVNYNRLHTPDTFTGFNIQYSMRALFDTRFFLIFRTDYRPLGNRDYFEPRVAGRYYETDAAYDLFALYSTDYRKRVYLDGDVSYSRKKSEEIRQKYGFEVRPTFRASDRLNMTYGFRYQGINNDIGFVGFADADKIHFGLRNTDTFTNRIRASYIFTNHLSLSFNLRHYWSLVEYSGVYYSLREDGRLDSLDEDLDVRNINYNAFTIDMLLTWHFAPGSQLTFAWKNNIDSNIANITRSYTDNLRNTLEQPQINSFSIRLLYYLDYQKIRKALS